MLLAGCATYGRIDNQPLTSAAARQPGYGMSEAASAGRRDDITLVLAFSGGGSRAAALAYGVLLELRDTRIGANGDRRLLDEVDAISAVSGGSFTAAYYGLHGDDTFRDFESGFLRRDLTSDVLHRILSPRRWFTPEGSMLPTEAEAAQQRAEAAQQRAERLAERLRQLGVDSDSVDLSDGRR